MGGSDDPSNIITVTVEHHAELHRRLWMAFECREDWLAWQGLLGEITHAEAVQEGRILGGKKAGGTKNWTEESFRKVREVALKNQSKAVEASLTDNARQNQKDAFVRIGHQQGVKNSMYGKRWIHSLSEKRSTRIYKTDPLPEGWTEGRKMKFC